MAAGAGSSALAAGPGAELPEEIVPEGESLWDLDGPGVAERVAAEAVTLVEGECGVPAVEDAVQVVGGTEQDRARFSQAAEGAGLEIGWGTVVTLLGARPRAVGMSSSPWTARRRSPIPLRRRRWDSSDGRRELRCSDRDSPGAEAPGQLPVQVGSSSWDTPRAERGPVRTLGA
ncbi:hypothetical protein [Nesterenkonia pannonica]|uniref:hypothetical protein n=1 Tax=Nesterenkonia pannonica TaxID=1548602 RepID=UPI002164688F|nr:hypothetical protein [Nesterenkonia pannonica]